MRQRGLTAPASLVSRFEALPAHPSESLSTGGQRLSEAAADLNPVGAREAVELHPDGKPRVEGKAITQVFAVEQVAAPDGNVGAAVVEPEATRLERLPRVPWLRRSVSGSNVTGPW